jgi:hypothetical protein
MLGNAVRDESVSPLVRKHLQPYHEFLAFIREPLLAGRGLRGRARRRTEAAIGHALSFETWKSLARDGGLSDDEAATLMTSLVDSAR